MPVSTISIFFIVVSFAAGENWITERKPPIKSHTIFNHIKLYSVYLDPERNHDFSGNRQ